MKWFKKRKSQPKIIGDLLSIKNPVIDTESITWAAIVKAIKAERSDLLESMVSARRTEKDRDVICGKIQVIDWLLKLPKRKDVFEGIN